MESGVKGQAFKDSLTSTIVSTFFYISVHFFLGYRALGVTISDKPAKVMNVEMRVRVSFQFPVLSKHTSHAIDAHQMFRLWEN